jgi:superfamily II DNA or RNA helicase
LRHEGFGSVRVLGQSGDEGADILAHRNARRWLVQVKFRQSGRIGIEVVDETVQASQIYRSNIPVVATNQYFSEECIRHQSRLMAAGTPLQLWDRQVLKKRWDKLSEWPANMPKTRDYQEGAVAAIVETFRQRDRHAALVVMATGLGKTFVAAEAIRRIRASVSRPLRVLVMAHTNELVYQLERAFWPLIDKFADTTVWNGYEVPNHTANFAFACVDSVAAAVRSTGEFPEEYDLVVIDECHHAGSPEYAAVIRPTGCGTPDGPFLIGMTATPWRPDGTSLEGIFGEPNAVIDIVEGLKRGWLSNVDYRMHVDNINWQELHEIHDLTPRGLNRVLFIQEWDDGVVRKLQEVWHEVSSPRALVFCGTIDHAITMRDRVNALGFGRAEAIYSGTLGAPRISHAQRARILADFYDGIVQILCAVDILNEGIDLPDVNIVVFQRVTHSRRIFVQQLGRGLRVSEGKDKVIVLDFVSDIRRFAAGIDLKNRLENPPHYVSLGNQVRFMSVSGEDRKTESFLREWLEDVAAVEAAGEDENVLKFPPALTERGELHR